MIKKTLFLIFTFLIPYNLNAATKNIVPNADNEGFLGSSSKRWANVHTVTGTVVGEMKIGSMTIYGTVTSTSGFVGDGSKLTGITASANQTKPLIAGDTGYFSIYSTNTISATQTFQSSITFSSTSLSIGGNLYHFQSSAPAVNSVLRYDDGGKVFWGNDGGGGGGGGSSLKVVIDSGTVYNTVSTMNVTHSDFASAFTGSTWTVRLSSNVARIDRTQIFQSSQSFESTVTMSSATVYGTVTMGDPSKTTPQLIINGGAVGGDILQLARSNGATVSYGISLAGGRMSFTDRVNSLTNLSVGGSAIESTLVAGFDSSGSGSAINSSFKASDGGAAGSDVRGANLRISSGRGRGNGTQSVIFLQTPNVQASGSTAQTDITQMTITSTAGVAIGGDLSVSSITAYGTITSTSGIIAGSTSTFNAAVIKKRIITVTDAASMTPDALIADVIHQINTQAAGTLTINNPTGSLNDGQSLLFRIKCTNSQSLSWGAMYRGGTTALPTSTTGSSKYDYYSFIWNGLDTKFDFTGKAEGF